MGEISKDYIKKLILDNIDRQDYRPLTPVDFFDDLNLTETHYTMYEGCLKKLLAEFKIYRNHRGQLIRIDKSPLKKGVFYYRRMNSGYVTVSDSRADDIFVPQTMTGGALSGDEVYYELLAQKRPESRKEARVVKIINRKYNRIVGNVREEDGEFYVAARKNDMYLRVYLKKGEMQKAKLGDIVVVKIKDFQNEHSNQNAGKKTDSAELNKTYGVISTIVGSVRSLQANYERILLENDVRTDFPETVLKQAETDAVRDTSPENNPDRADFTDKLIFTVDGETAKDFDDAISIEKDGDDNFLLGVHIADVSHYVDKGSPMDNEAFLRGTSIYFADKVIPMLPPQLSEEACSLKQGENRLAFSVIMTINRKGEITDSRFVKSVIKSKIRGVYSEINSIYAHMGETGEFDHDDIDIYRKYRTLKTVFPVMRELAGILNKKRYKEGSVKLNTAESVFVMDYSQSKGEYIPVNIRKKTPGISEDIIEEFMIAANRTVGKFLHENDYPAIYRVHEPPSDDKTVYLTEILDSLGFDVEALKSGAKLTSGIMTGIMKEASKKKIEMFINLLLMRTMSKAVYSEVSVPHFGLSIENYLHFTSPIRRYPDLVVHRVLTSIINGDYFQKSRKYYRTFVKKAAVRSTETEMTAISASRGMELLYKCAYINKYVGEEFTGVVINLKSTGISVMLDNTCEGFINIETLDGYYELDKYKSILNCLSSTGSSVRVGDIIHVRVVSVDMVNRVINLEKCR